MVLAALVPGSARAQTFALELQNISTLRSAFGDDVAKSLTALPPAFYKPARARAVALAKRVSGGEIGRDVALNALHANFSYINAHFADILDDAAEQCIASNPGEAVVSDILEPILLARGAKSPEAALEAMVQARLAKGAAKGGSGEAARRDLCAKLEKKCNGPEGAHSAFKDAVVEACAKKSEAGRLADEARPGGEESLDGSIEKSAAEQSDGVAEVVPTAEEHQAQVAEANAAADEQEQEAETAAVGGARSLDDASSAEEPYYGEAVNMSEPNLESIGGDEADRSAASVPSEEPAREREPELAPEY